MEFWRVALYSEVFQKKSFYCSHTAREWNVFNGILLLVKKSSTTSLNHCHRKLHSGNHYVKACESLQRDNYNFFQLHPADIVDILVENVSLPAINVTSIHVIGWVLPLCREIWLQMRWSNFENACFWVASSSFLLEPVHSSESECTGWTNRRIVLTKYHSARALGKLI